MATTKEIEQALVPYGIKTTGYQIEQIKDLIARTRFRSEYIIKLIKDPDLEMISLDDRIYAIGQLESLNVSGSSLKKFVKEGYNISEFLDIVRYARETIPEVIEFKSRPSGFIPNLANILGYDNLIFLDRLTSNAHDPLLINSKINEIIEAMETADRDFGLAEVVYRVREEYMNADKRKELITFPVALQKALNSILPGFDESIADDSYMIDIRDSIENISDRD